MMRMTRRLITIGLMSITVSAALGATTVRACDWKNNLKVDFVSLNDNFQNPAVKFGTATGYCSDQYGSRSDTSDSAKKNLLSVFTAALLSGKTVSVCVDTTACTMWSAILHK